jgi:DNA-binding HxlR family transcriptional regulator
MLGRYYEHQACSAARTLEAVGERWSMLILRNAIFRGMTRFSEFQKSLEVAPNILARRLESFVASGIMEARPYGPNPEHRQYVLTEKGRDLQPIIVALTAWGDKWVGGGPIVYEHAVCGGLVEQHLHCTECGRTPELAEVLATRVEEYWARQG